MGRRTYSDCVSAARFVIDALGEVGEPWACLVGVFATHLYGVDTESNIKASRF
jgi:hypothetical protein